MRLGKRKSEYSTGEMRRLTEMKDIDTDVELYNDRSTDCNQNKWGAGVYIQDRNTNRE